MAKQYKRIFAALDGGQTQNMVAERAIELAADTHAALMFGHVVDSVRPGPARVPRLRPVRRV